MTKKIYLLMIIIKLNKIKNKIIFILIKYNIKILNKVRKKL